MEGEWIWEGKGRWDKAGRSGKTGNVVSRYILYDRRIYFLKKDSRNYDSDRESKVMSHGNNETFPEASSFYRKQNRLCRAKTNVMGLCS